MEEAKKENKKRKKNRLWSGYEIKLKLIQISKASGISFKSFAFHVLAWASSMKKNTCVYIGREEKNKGNFLFLLRVKRLCKENSHTRKVHKNEYFRRILKIAWLSLSFLVCMSFIFSLRTFLIRSLISKNMLSYSNVSSVSVLLPPLSYIQIHRKIERLFTDGNFILE